jgi:hypothetical protein
MGLRSAQDNENTSVRIRSLENRYPFLVIRSAAERSDLRFRKPFVEMFLDRGVMGLRPTEG